MRKINSIQKWIPIEKILEKGIIKLKKNKYIKILKVNPINFNLKTQMEKESILNSYKIFLKTCNFDIQILIQSKKEDLTNHIEKIKINSQNENNKFINNYLNEYINYIKEKNNLNKSASKNFYLIIKYIFQFFVLLYFSNLFSVTIKFNNVTNLKIFLNYMVFLNLVALLYYLQIKILYNQTNIKIFLYNQIKPFSISKFTHI